MQFDLSTKLDRMAEVSRKRTAYRALMGFYERLFRERERCAQNLALSAPKVDLRIMTLKARGGFPILDKSGVTLDMDVLTSLFISLLKISREKNPEAVADIGYFFQRKNIEVSTVIQSVWNGDLEFMGGERQELRDPFLLYFLLIESLKPVYTRYAQILQEHLKNVRWEQGYCPICGELPPISEVAERGTCKNLFCVYCETLWPFQPASCPFCRKEEETSRKRLYMGGEREYYLEVCDECQKYIKVVDTDVIGKPVPLDVENIATIHLDMVAQQEGFERGAPIQLLV